MHILITGASSGIGEALARHFGDNPENQLTLVARREDRLRTLADSIAATTQIFSVDLALSDTQFPWLEEAVAKSGPVDLLINNAGMNCIGLAHQVAAEDAARLFRLNVLTPMALASAVVPAMQERSSGTIVNVASVAAVNTPPGMSYYASTKAALATWSEGLHVDLRKDNIQVLTVYPGPVATPMETQARAAFGENLGIADKLPMGTADELAEKIDRAIARGHRKLYYPGFYRSSFWLPNMSQCLTETFAPPLPAANESPTSRSA